MVEETDLKNGDMVLATDYDKKVRDALVSEGQICDMDNLDAIIEETGLRKCDVYSIMIGEYRPRLSHAEIIGDILDVEMTVPYE